MLTTSNSTNGMVIMVFGPIPWNLDTANPDFVPGLSSLNVGLLSFIGADGFEGGVTNGQLLLEEVPEPATGVLLGIAAAAVGGLSSRRRRASLQSGPANIEQREVTS